MRVLILITLIFAGGCASVGVQHTPTFLDWETGKKINFTTVTLTDVNALAPTTTVKIVLQCEPLNEENELENSKCRPADVGRQDSAPGALTGLGSTVINSAAIVGGAYFVGKGIGDSADRNTTTHNDNDILQTGQNANIGNTVDHYGGAQSYDGGTQTNTQTHYTTP